MVQGSRAGASGDDPKRRAEHCETIIKEADRLSDMVGEILELSRLETNVAEITTAELNISLLFADILSSFRELSVKDGYTFITDIEENLYVLGNEPLLRRAIYNLISNAINFTGEDKLIYISLKTVRNSVRFEVTDTGQGIPENKQNVIWERYYKTGEMHRRAVVGSGLGLSIVKNILIQHKSEYGVNSEPGKGSTFWFELKKTRSEPS